MPGALAVTSTDPTARRPRRIAVTALAALFMASAGPASGSSHEETTGSGARDERRSAQRADASSDRLGAAVPVPLAIDVLVDAVRAVVHEVAAVPFTAEEPGMTTIRLRPRPGPGAFSMNLYSKGDFLSQQTTYWCIPASTQTMMNIMDAGRPDRSRALQARLYRIGDNLEEDGSVSDEIEPDDFRGMGISEWVGLLNRFDYGPYELGRASTRQSALRKAARLMRKTGKPVGLVVWQGAHAWVMSGFTATADPAYAKDFTVTSVWVQDPWYPRVSSTWGPSRPPNARVSASALGQDFVPYDRPQRRHPGRDGKFMLVLPKLAPGTRVA
jgi:hypothetical protein